MGTLKGLQFAWTDEQVEFMLQAFHAGDSASVIAQSLSTHTQRVTRNSVIGRLHRMGIRREPTTEVRAAKKRHPRHRPVKREPFKPHVRLAAPPPAPEPIPDTPDDQIPIEQRRTIEQLTNTTCRWPVGAPSHPDFFYCGHESADLIAGRPYCAVHTARAFAGHGRAPERYPWSGT